MKRFRVLILVAAGLMAGVLLIGLMGSAVPVSANPDISIQVNYGHDWVQVNTTPSTNVEVTVSDNQGVKGTYNDQSDTNGDLFTHGGGWNPDGWVQIDPGDIVSATAGIDSTAVNPIGVINGDLDLDADKISGTIEASWFTTVDVSCNIWVNNGPNSIDVPNVSGDGGSYTCDFSGAWDIKPGQTVAVSYSEPDGDQVINTFQGPWMNVNYAHDWVGGTYPAGHTFTVTVKDSSNVVKATAVVNTVSGGGWGGDGFQTEGEDWLPEQPDIVPGDSVMFESDDSYLNTVKVGDIGGTLDLVGNKISGPINASWLTEELPVRCEIWTDSGGPDGKDSTAAPDGSKSYECSWDSEWDIQPGQDVAVMYREPDADQVINVFYEPAPDLQVEKWPEGNGQSAPGSPLVFHMRFENQGEATAQSITLTDTMPANTTYISDSSGISPTLSSGKIIWNMGSLDPNKEKEFFLVLGNSASAGDTLLNKLEGITPLDPNDGNDYAEAEVQIVAGQPDLYVDKWAEPGDPVPGQTFEYRINYGNNGPVASGQVTLTDMLPPQVTVVDWYSHEGYNLWQDISGGGNFVLQADSIPGEWGDEIHLRVRLDANVDLGTELYNKVMIATANDSDPENNQSEDWRDVGEPRWNGRADKSFNWGVLAPGGRVEYNLHANNDGNMKTDLTLTDLIPLGTTFDEAWSEVNGERVSFPPDDVDGRKLTWNLGSFEPGEGQGIDLRLKLDKVNPGDSIVNCATVAISEDDQRPYDDTSCSTEMINERGPNLRVTKHHWWDNDDRIRFTFHVENIGTTTLRDVEIVDTYPEDTQFNDEWWHDYWQELKFTHNATERKLIWKLEELRPDHRFEINFILNVDGAVVGDQGLAFTNLVQAPVTGDVYPADNSDEDTAYSGPNLFVKKWLATKLPYPGEVVTFVVEFGNATQGYWGTSGDTSLVDTVGAGMTFISATDPDNPGEFWLPKLRPDGKLLWEWGNMHSDSHWRFEMKVKIDDDVSPLAFLTNKIVVSNESQDDIDPVPENNMDEATFRAGQVIFTPVVMK
jgi:uncharacterized repeat protein (TIGR01451 family)